LPSEYQDKRFTSHNSPIEVMDDQSNSDQVSLESETSHETTKKNLFSTENIIAADDANPTLEEVREYDEESQSENTDRKSIDE
jgi:hypothetical protein